MLVPFEIEHGTDRVEHVLRWPLAALFNLADRHHGTFALIGEILLGEFALLAGQDDGVEGAFIEIDRNLRHGGIIPCSLGIAQGMVKECLTPIPNGIYNSNNHTGASAMTKLIRMIWPVIAGMLVGLVMELAILHI